MTTPLDLYDCYCKYSSPEVYKELCNKVPIFYRNPASHLHGNDIAMSLVHDSQLKNIMEENFALKTIKFVDEKEKKEAVRSLTTYANDLRLKAYITIREDEKHL